MDYNLPGNEFHICRLFLNTKLTYDLYNVFDLLKVYNLFNDRQPSQLAKRLVNNLSGPIKHGNTNNPLFDDFDDFDQQALAAQQRPVYVPRPNILPQPIAVKLLDILTFTFFIWIPSSLMYHINHYESYSLARRVGLDQKLLLLQNDPRSCSDWF